MIDPFFTDTDNEPWRKDALCSQTDPEAFFPEKGGSTRAAKKVCGECPVRTRCLAWAFATEQHYGVWGGLSSRERRALVRQGVAAVADESNGAAA